MAERIRLIVDKLCSSSRKAHWLLGQTQTKSIKERDLCIISSSAQRLLSWQYAISRIESDSNNMHEIGQGYAKNHGIDYSVFSRSSSRLVTLLRQLGTQTSTPSLSFWQAEKIMSFTARTYVLSTVTHCLGLYLQMYCRRKSVRHRSCFYRCTHRL